MKKLNVNGLYRPNKIKAVVVEGVTPVVELYNENSEMFHWFNVWNKDSKASEKAIKHYTTKDVVLSIIKAIENKFKVKKIIHDYDVDHLENILGNWIVSETIIGRFEKINKNVKLENYQSVMNEILDIKFKIKHSVPTMDNNGFYLFEKY